MHCSWSCAGTTCDVKMSSIFVRDSWNLCKESMHWLPRYFAAATGVLSSPNLSHCCVAARNAVTRCLRTFANLPRDLRALAKIAVTEAMTKTRLEVYIVASPKVFPRLEWRIWNKRNDADYEENMDKYVPQDIWLSITQFKGTCIQFRSVSSPFVPMCQFKYGADYSFSHSQSGKSHKYGEL